MMATETPRLDTIAPELLQTILSFISGPDTSEGGTVDVQVSRVRSLHALAMTSKQLHYETLPYLFRRFETYNSDISLAFFARSLCENAELAKCVQVFDAFNVSTTQSQLPNPQDIKVLKTALVPLKLAKISLGIEAALDEHCACAFYLLLISLTTRLKCLKLSFYSNARLSGRLMHNDVTCPCCCSFNESLQKILGSHIPGHQNTNLQTFQFGPRREGDVGLLATVLQLPAMRDITLMSFGDVSSSYDWTGCTNLSTVEDIHIEDSFLLDEDIAGLITCCKKLKSLSIWWNSDAIDKYRISTPAVDTSTVLAALKSHRECLERLVLTNSCGQSFVSSYPTNELSFFTALSDLDVDDNFLLEGRSWQSFKLPSNLKVLTIYMETPFIGFYQVFRAIGQTAQRDLSDVTITIPFDGNESHTDPFVGVWEVAGTDEPGKHMMTVQIDMNKEGSPWFYHLWTEDVSYSMKMRFLGEDMGQLMDFCAEQLVIHGVDFLINTRDYLPHSQSSHTAG